MKSFFVIIICVLFSFHAKADCIACWSLVKVNITLTNGDSVTGFVKWNDTWLVYTPNEIEWIDKFPESLIYYYNNNSYSSELTVIKRLYNVKIDSLIELKITSPEDLLKFDISEIRTIEKIPNNTESYSGAGDLPTFSKDNIEKLQTEPFAQVRFEASLSDVYMLSYNPEITEEQLAVYNESNYYSKIEELNKQGVITIVVSYD